MEKRIIGVTGGVGSGKSTVLNCLREEWAADVWQADELAKKVMAPGGAAYERLVRELGEGILREDGEIDRRELSELIYSREEKRQLVNRIVHGLVRQEAEERIRNSAAALVVYEAALPEEACLRELCGEVWLVMVPAEERIRRLMRDRGYSRERALAIMDAQLPEEKFLALADRVIDNSGSPEETRRQVRDLLEAGDRPAGSSNKEDGGKA